MGWWVAKFGDKVAGSLRQPDYPKHDANSLLANTLELAILASCPRKIFTGRNNFAEHLPIFASYKVDMRAEVILPSLNQK